MHTVFDWMTLLIFSGFATLFLHRSVGSRVVGDHPWKYLPAALGCVAINLLGNAGHRLPALLILAIVVLYGVTVLKPWIRNS